MVTLKDVYKAVCENITKATKITVVDSDFDEPIIRPSFRIFCDTVKSGNYNAVLKETKAYFDIYYYAKNGKIDIMDIEDKISFAFLEPLRIRENCAVYIDDLEFEKLSNKILNIGFSIEIVTKFVDESQIETMEKLNFRRN